MAPRKIERLQSLATEMVGDGGTPDLFFVTQEGVVVMVTRDFQSAYDAWFYLLHHTQGECALENRRIGCVASREPSDDNGGRMIVCDDSQTVPRTLAAKRFGVIG